MPRAAASAMRIPVKLPGPTPTAIWPRSAKPMPGLGEHLQEQRHQRLGMAALHRPAAVGGDRAVAPQGGRAGGAGGIESKYRPAHRLGLPARRP